MTSTLDRATTSAAPTGGSRLRSTLLALVGVAVLVLAGSAGFLWGRHDGSSAPSAVDIGFTRDMATHHQQAVTMAGYARDNAQSDPAVFTVAYDIETSQSLDLGRMRGWLEQWGASPNTDAPMSWMADHHMAMSGSLMPGMATPAQLAALQTLHGKALSILFLQLMIRHHQGGVAMADYAAAHASLDYVRFLAQQMAQVQTREIVQMEQLLRARGGVPLAPPG